jgi:hypothetical protein
MNIFKKTTGVLLLVFAALFSIAVLASFLNGIVESSKEINKSTTSGIAYAFGSLITLAIFVAILYFIIKLGLKLIKKKNTRINSIDEIGLEK